MSIFVVVNEQGPAWIPDRSMREQPGWSDHADFMNGLVDKHWIALGGPLRGGSTHRAMLVVQGPDPATVRARLDADPWIRSGVLRTVSFEPWELLLGTLE